MAARDILGLDLAPHHALILREWCRDKPTNDWTGSRGTGKTVLLAIFYLLNALLYPKNKLVIIGGGGFRQSKFVMLEIEKIIKCRLSGQRSVFYTKGCLENPNKIINKDPAFWHIIFKHGSQIFALPIGQAGETIRGARAFKTGLDEAFLIPEQIKQAILEPMSYVLADPSGKEQSISTQDFNTSTVDYTTRGYWKNYIENRRRIQSGAEDISTFEFNYEDCFTVKKDGTRHAFWGMNFDKIIKAKTDPNKDLSIWMAENKNTPMDISDGYFPVNELERAANFAIDEKIDLFLQPLLGCESPCILGIDNAPTEANTAFTVIRAGVLSEDRRNPEICKELDYKLEDEIGCPFVDRKSGKCKLGDYNNVVYTFEENQMSLKNRVKLVYDLLKNFNITHIFMDKRGGGWELAELLRDRQIISEVVSEDVPILFDPTDERNINMQGSPILNLLATDAQMNLKFNSFLKGQISHLKLLFPKPVLVCSDERLKQIYDSLKMLLLQISRIKAHPAGSWFSFEIEGLDLEGRRKKLKKDLYSSLLYAVGGLRLLLDERDKDDSDMVYKELEGLQPAWIRIAG